MINPSTIVVRLMKQNGWDSVSYFQLCQVVETSMLCNGRDVIKQAEDDGFVYVSSESLDCETVFVTLTSLGYNFDV